MNKLSVVLISFLLLMPFAFADYWSCYDGASSTNSSNYTGVTYLTWNNITVTNNTRLSSVTHITNINAFTFNSTEDINLSASVGNNVLDYFYLNNASLHMWTNIPWVSDEIPQRANNSACYQETTNATSVTDGTCTLNYTGTYAATDDWVDGNDTHDGSIVTYGVTDGVANATMYINYTKPIGVTAPIKWAVADGNITALPWYVNVTIDDSCLQAYTNVLVLSVVSSADGDQKVEWNCNNGTDWVNLRQRVAGNSNRVYEEGIFWNINGTWVQGMSVDGESYVRVQNASMIGQTINMTYTRTIAAGTDLTNSTVMNTVCLFGCPSYETVENTNYSINGNVTSTWRITASTFTGQNWTVNWGEVGRSCTWVTTSSTSCQQTKTTLFAGFALLAIVAIAVSAFLIINIFKDGMDMVSMGGVAIAVISLGIIIMAAYYIIGTIALSTCV